MIFIVHRGGRGAHCHIYNPKLAEEIYNNNGFVGQNAGCEFCIILSLLPQAMILPNFNSYFKNSLVSELNVQIFCTVLVTSA